MKSPTAFEGRDLNESSQDWLANRALTAVSGVPSPPQEKGWVRALLILLVFRLIL